MVVVNLRILDGTQSASSSWRGLLGIYTWENVHRCGGVLSDSR
jgi:hypothetical protein